MKNHNGSADRNHSAVPLQLEHIEAIEKRLWNAADTLRSNSNYASNEYFMPVMGLIFLRHAYSRYLSVKDDIEASLPKRGGKKRTLSKEDFSRKSAIFLRPEAQFDSLVGLTDSDDRAKAIIDAMESIEADYETLRGVLPKAEYQELDNAVLGQLLRTLNPEVLKRSSGDVFGRIYEYFLTQFADLKAHDNGEFFTPMSLVALIANVIEPAGGVVLDPACGSGGMFVQSAHFVERLHANPSDKLTFYGLEKNATTIRLAKMNLAVHGLEGNIQKAITYYEDPHELAGKADFVMANPPFNVDEVDADKVLMIDARNIYRKVTRKIYDFSPEQLQNQLAIVWLYRGQADRFLNLVFGYLRSMLYEISYCYRPRTPDSLEPAPLFGYVTALNELIACIEPFTDTLDHEAAHAETMKQLVESMVAFHQHIDGFQSAIDEEKDPWQKQRKTATALKQAVQRLARLVEASRDLSRQADAVFKLVCRLIEICENDLSARTIDLWSGRDIGRLRKAADAARHTAVEQLNRVRYFHKQAAWLTERFPDGALHDVEGLIKLVDRAELEANDWSLTPGRYVGVAPEVEDDGFDFEEALRDIHIELEGMNTEAAELAARISRNFKELGI